MRPGMASPLSQSSLRSPSSTRDLFTQASNSLSNLADEVQTINMEGREPPPYEEPPSSPPQDSKRRQRYSRAESTILGNDDVFQCILDNRIDTIQKMVEAGIGIDETDATGRTPLMHAASLRRAYICHILLQAGPLRLHLRDSEQNTALHYSALQGDVEVCRLLIDAGSQLAEYNANGHTPIDLAARGGHAEATDCLLNCWTAQGGHASTLLNGFLEAVKSCNVATARAFVDRGVQPKKIKDAWKPVAYAAMSGSIPMIDFLVAHRVNLKEKSPSGWTALHQAAWYGHTPMVEKLMSWSLPWKASTKKDQETALHLSIRAGHTATSLALIRHKDASLSVEDVNSQQPIHHAVRNGAMDLTAAILDKDPKLGSATNDFGWTPMLIAAAYGHSALVADFILRGHSTEEKLGSPSFKPAKKTHDASIKGYWCEIRWPHPGATALSLAIEFGHDEVARMLISHGAKIDEPDSQNWRPLHYAAFHGRSAIVDLLLDRGVSPHSTTSSGNTAMSLGFREPGLTIESGEKQYIHEALHAAMNARKKTKLQSLGSFMSGGNKAREAGERNKAWHTAELAAMLYQADVDDGSSDLQMTGSINSQSQVLTEDDVYHDIPGYASSSRLMGMAPQTTEQGIDRQDRQGSSGKRFG